MDDWQTALWYDTRNSMSEELKRMITYTYRSMCGQYLVEKAYDFFDDAPDYITEDDLSVEFVGDSDHQYERIPNQATKGWINTEFISENGKQSFNEFWRVGSGPETLDRDGVTYIRQFGVAKPMDAMRTGSGLLSKCDRGFQDLMHHAHNKTAGSELDKRF